MKNNIRFLLPIVLGAVFGIFLFGNILLFLFNRFYVVTSLIFVVLILASIPSVIKQANITKVNFLHIICLLFTFAFSLYLIAIEKNYSSAIVINSFPSLIFSGILMSAGVVVPGVSKTVILMLLGTYPAYLTAISTLNFAFLMPIAIGIAIGSVLFLGLINFLFTHFKSYTYFSIIGFVLGSVPVIWPY